MPGMEGIIRPFTVRNNQPRGGRSSVTGSQEPVKLVWGKGGGVKSGSMSYNFKVTRYMEKREKETTSDATTSDE